MPIGASLRQTHSDTGLRESQYEESQCARDCRGWLDHANRGFFGDQEACDSLYRTRPEIPGPMLSATWPVYSVDLQASTCSIN